MLKKILSQSALYGLAPNVSKIIGFAILPILTKYLTDVDYGISLTIAAYTGAIAVFSTLGMNIVLTTSFYRYKYQYKWIWRQIYGFLQYWMIIFAILQSILLYFIIPEEAQENRWAIIFLSNFATVFFGATSLVGVMYYRLHQNPVPIAIRSAVSGILTVLANLLFVVYFEMGYMGWYISSFIAGCFINASYWWPINKKYKLSPIFRFKARTIKHALKIALPTIPHYYSSYLLNSSSRMVMDRSGLSMGKIGDFGFASQFGGYFDVFVNAVNMAVNPMTLEQIRNNKEKYAKKLIYAMAVITISATFLFSLWAKEIFFLMVNNAHLQTVYPMAIIFVMAYNYRPMYIASTNMFFYYENTVGLLKISFIAGILAFISYIVVIPIWGIWGAVIINFIFLQYMGYSGFFMKGYRSKTKVKYPFIAFFLITIALTLFVFWAVELAWQIKAGITVVFSLSAFFFLKSLNLNEIDEDRH
ncbi:MAG: oligosaccharide flippase family protein [Bacteroidales bacterium]|nr:oligosaccharide flippase family protein [Bacteroidales bacterium]